MGVVSCGSLFGAKKEVKLGMEWKWKGV